LAILDLFDNLVSCQTSPPIFQAKALQNRIFFIGCCLETEVSKQLYFKKMWMQGGAGKSAACGGVID
jgi:hypothetical protein